MATTSRSSTSTTRSRRISQPVRRLRGFERVTLKPGEKTTVSWKLDASDVGFYDNQGKFRVEPGKIEVYAGDSSSQTRHRADVHGALTLLLS